MCKRNSNAEHSSRFICLRCLKENGVGAGIIRVNMRESGHIKDLICLCTKLEEKTKNLEVRWCDNFAERMEYAREIQSNFYDAEGNLIRKAG